MILICTYYSFFFCDETTDLMMLYMHTPSQKCDSIGISVFQYIKKTRSSLDSVF